MKNSCTTLTSSTSNRAMNRRTARAILITCVLAAATMVVPAMATSCPPGDRGTYPHCMPRPAPAKPDQPYAAHSNAQVSGAVPVTTQRHPYPSERKIVDPHTLPPPTGPGPVEHPASASNTQPVPPGHSPYDQAAINSQPVPPGHLLHDKGALNPQPIPTGHSLRRIPKPVAPVETGGP